MADTPQENLCPQCSRPLPPGRPRGLCPACLLKRGLETNTVGYTDEDQAEAAKRWTPPTVEQLAPIFPELDILELIGRGGMGAVYKARQKQLDRLVALKILPPEIGREEAFAQRFAREAQWMAKLSHPNIVAIYSFGQRSADDLAAGGDLYFFIMEYVDGLSLRQLLDAGTVSPKEALAIVPQICDALQYAHDRRIVHRDIKPENILLNRGGHVKIADFGLAKLVGLAARGAAGPTAAGAEAGSPGAPGSTRRSPTEPVVTQAGEKVMGTPQYMAPEQIERPREVDHRADIYSLGVVFYQMLTGELPKGPERFEPPSRKVLIDVRLDEVVLRALQREPARRYQHVSEVRTQVETIVGGNAPPPPPAQQAAYGWEYRSKRTLWGLPLVHIAEGYDPDTGQPRQAKGIVAYGSSAKGIIALGGRATGIVAFGGLAIGVIAFGGLSLSLIGFGGLVLAALFAYGGVTFAPFVVGGVATGLYAEGGFRTSLYRLSDAWTIYASGSFYAVAVALGVMAIWLGAVARRHRPWATRRSPSSATEQLPEMERARQAVKAPAIGLVVAAAISLAVLFAMIAVVTVFHRIPWIHIEPWVLALLGLGLSPNIFVFFAAIEMLNLKGRVLAVVASVLALLLSPGNIIGLPMGIWALVVLSRREVIDAFKAFDRDKTMGKSRAFMWLLLAVVAILTPMAVWAASRAGEGRNTQPTSQPFGNWKVTLPSGVTVELLGVSVNPSDGKRWWRPDGSPLAQRPYSHLRASVRPGSGERGNEFVVRLANLPKEHVGTRWEFDPPTSYAGGGSVVAKGDALPQLRAIAAITPASQDVVTVKLGVAAGTWNTLAEASGSGSSSTGRGKIGVSFSRAHEEDNAVVVTVAHNVEDQDVRVVAVDMGGEELKPGRSMTGGAENVHQLSCTFYNMRSNNVKEFRLQARPYEWVTFKNVSLVPRDNQRSSQHMILGRVIQRVVNHTGENCLIDLDTGTLATPPKEAFEGGSKTAVEWVRKHGIDAGGGTQPEVQGLIGFDMIALPVDNKVWDLSGDAGLLADKRNVFAVSTPGNPVYLSAKGGVPATYKFQTREGALGVLQVVGFTDNPKGTKIRYKLLQAAPSAPHVLKTTPVAFADDVDPALDKITVTFDRPMMDKSWSFTAGGKAFSEKTGSIFPERTGEVSYDAARTTCTMPVKLQPGKVYWVGINSSGLQYFKSADGVPVRPYQILFATRTADGDPTPLPRDLVKEATIMNSGSSRLAANLTHHDWFVQASQRADRFLAALRQGVPAEAYRQTTSEYRANHQGGLERLVEHMDLSKAEPVQVHVAMEAACVIVSPVTPKKRGAAMSMGLGMIRVGRKYLIRDIDALPNERAVKEFVDGFREAYPAGIGGAIGRPSPQSRAEKRSTEGGNEALQGKLKTWVEDFFSRNYRDITARKTLEWGQPETTPDGNLSIRYKYLATIWNKDQQIIEQRFTFTPEGKYVSAETITKVPASQPATRPSNASTKANNRDAPYFLDSRRPVGSLWARRGPQG